MSFPLLHDPEKRRRETAISKIPVIGWQVNYFNQISEEQDIIEQAKTRGPVPEDEWAGLEYDKKIKDKITEICRERAFDEDTTFHPNDPFELMSVLRYGDLNEVEIIMDIEEEYGISFDDQWLQNCLIIEKMTFFNFIKYIEANRKPGYVPLPKESSIKQSFIFYSIAFLVLGVIIFGFSDTKFLWFTMICMSFWLVVKVCTFIRNKIIWGKKDKV